MIIEELAFKDRRTLANLNEKDLLDIIEFLQDDRKEWINQFSRTHNESIKIQEENQELKSQLKGTTHCFDEEEHKRLSEQLELLTSKLDEYDLIVDERNQLKKQLKNMTDNYCNASKLKHERANKIVEMNNQQKKLKEQLENSIKVNMADHKYASECEDKVVILEAYQKKFTKWLEDEIHTIETTFSQINGNYGLMNEKLEALKEVLEKYEEIMNGDDKNE